MSARFFFLSGGNMRATNTASLVVASVVLLGCVDGDTFVKVVYLTL